MKTDNLLTIKDVVINKGLKLPDITLSSGDILWLQTDNNLQADVFSSFMLGLFEIKQGKATLAGNDITRNIKIISYTDISRWNPKTDTVATFIKLLAHAGNFQISSVMNEFRRILDGMGAGYALNLNFDEMSVNTKIMVSTATTLSMPRLVVMLLEPFTGLDKEGIAFISNEIKKTALDGSSLIIISDSEPSVHSKHVKMGFGS